MRVARAFRDPPARWLAMAVALVSLLSLAGSGTMVLADGIAPERLRDLTGEWEAKRTRILGPFHNLYNPCIVHERGAYPYKMWFFGWAVEDYNPTRDGRKLGDAIYHARSRDLLHWEVYAGQDAQGRDAWDARGEPKSWVPVLTIGTDVYDNAAVGDPSVVKRGGRYYMAFSSVGFDVRRDENPARMYLVACVKGAVSTDGLRWQRTDKPLLLWEKEFTVRQVAGDPKLPPEYYGSYHRPSLMYDGGRWRLWFDYFHPATFVSLGYAENRGDFMAPADWKVLRAGKDPLLRDWPNTSVIKVGRDYYAFSDAPYYPPEYGGDGRLLTMARSRDGLAWEVLGHLQPEGPASSHVPETLLVRQKDGQWLYVFYAWKPETPKGGPWDYRYKEIRFMRKRVGK